MVSQSIQQTLGSAWMMFVVGISILLIILASGSDGTVWGMLGLIVGTACGLLGIYVGHTRSGDSVGGCQG